MAKKCVEPAKRGTEYFDVLNEAMERFHPELLEAEVTISIMIVSPTEGEEPVLKLHGYPCAAVVRINPTRARAQGIADATIDVDLMTWKDLDYAGRLALLDHELEHLVVCRDKEGQIKSDDRGRPNFKMKPHDLVVGGFTSIIARHGAKALEHQHIRVVNEVLRQRHFDFWTSDVAPQDEMPDVRDLFEEDAA